jgi:hypothetical protein
MVAALVLGGLLRCEVLGLRLDDLEFGERRVFVAEGEGGHQRLIPLSARFFAEVGAYLEAERPADGGTDKCSWCSRARTVACRCRRRGWMRSWTAPAAGPGRPMRPVISCGIPARTGRGPSPHSAGGHGGGTSTPQLAARRPAMIQTRIA